jgi:hypothetical protein
MVGFCKMACKMYEVNFSNKDEECMTKDSIKFDFSTRITERVTMSAVWRTPFHENTFHRLNTLLPNASMNHDDDRRKGAILSTLILA